MHVQAGMGHVTRFGLNGGGAEPLTPENRDKIKAFLRKANEGDTVELAPGVRLTDPVEPPGTRGMDAYGAEVTLDEYPGLTVGLEARHMSPGTMTFRYDPRQLPEESRNSIFERVSKLLNRLLSAFNPAEALQGQS